MAMLSLSLWLLVLDIWHPIWYIHTFSQYLCDYSINVISITFPNGQFTTLLHGSRSARSNSNSCRNMHRHFGKYWSTELYILSKGFPTWNKRSCLLIPLPFHRGLWVTKMISPVSQMWVFQTVFHMRVLVLSLITKWSERLSLKRQATSLMLCNVPLAYSTKQAFAAELSRS